MGTDRMPVYRGPCDCGGGEYQVDFCTPDHPYPTQSRWLGYEITCDLCRGKYSLEVRGNGLVQILKSDIEERERRQSRWHDTYKKAMKEAQPYLEQFASRLREEPSIAAIYRLLHKTGLFPLLPTEQTFRRHWHSAGSAETWVKVRLRNIEKLPALLKFLGEQNEHLEEEVKAAEELYKTLKTLTPPPGQRVATVQL